MLGCIELCCVVEQSAFFACVVDVLCYVLRCVVLCCVVLWLEVSFSGCGVLCCVVLRWIVLLCCGV